MKVPLRSKAATLDQPDPRSFDDARVLWRVDDTRGAVKPVQRLVKIDAASVTCLDALERRADPKRTAAFRRLLRSHSPARLPTVVVTTHPDGRTLLTDGVEAYLAARDAKTYLWAWRQMLIEDAMPAVSAPTEGSRSAGPRVVAEASPVDGTIRRGTSDRRRDDPSRAPKPTARLLRLATVADLPSKPAVKRVGIVSPPADVRLATSSKPTNPTRSGMRRRSR